MPAQRLAEALQELNAAQNDGIVRTAQLKRAIRERLIRAGFLQEIIRGWYFIASPGAPGTTLWYGHYWAFLRQYFAARFGNDYCLLPEASLRLLTGSTVVPRQLAVMRRSAGQQRLPLPLNGSLYIYQDKNNFPQRTTEINGVRVMEPSEAIQRVPESFFHNAPEEAALALRLLRDPSPLLRDLLEQGRTVVAGRLAGAFRQIDDAPTADRLLRTMRNAGHGVRESNPFAAPPPPSPVRSISPYAARLQTMWASLRQEAAKEFPPAPLFSSALGYLDAMDENYVQDAYHSLSIEGYRVTPELIERIRSGQWTPEGDPADREGRDALAARGYYEAFGAVRVSVARILAGESAAAVVRDAHQDWYQALFAPSVRAGLLGPGTLAGYRNGPVYIQGSRHVPLPAHALTDAMEAFFNLLREEPNPAVQAVLGHFLFGFIHPYADGNGRMARFLMNAFFAGGGYPWTIIHLNVRERYMTALETASVEGDITPFARMIRAEMEKQRS